MSSKFIAISYAALDLPDIPFYEPLPT